MSKQMPCWNRRAATLKPLGPTSPTFPPLPSPPLPFSRFLHIPRRQKASVIELCGLPSSWPFFSSSSSLFVTRGLLARYLRHDDRGPFNNYHHNLHFYLSIYLPIIYLFINFLIIYFFRLQIIYEFSLSFFKS